MNKEMRPILAAGVVLVAKTVAAVAPQLDLQGVFPPEVKTVGVVMPASILEKAKFERGVAALREAGYRVKLAPRLRFDKVASVEDRVKDFEETWMDSEVDLVLCARGGTGAEDVIVRIDWGKLRARPDQKVLGFSNITMILNAMLKEKAGHPISGSSISQMNYAKGDTFEWLCRAVAGAPQPVAKLRVLRPGAFSGLPCGGHIALVRRGIDMKWSADAKGRVVFLEREDSATLEGCRQELKAILRSGFLTGAAGVIFGDVTLKDATPEQVEELKRDFAVRAGCPVCDGFAYGHVPISHAIDFCRRVTVDEGGAMTWETPEHRVGVPSCGERIPTVGDSRLRIRFDLESGWPCAYEADGRPFLVATGGLADCRAESFVPRSNHEAISVVTNEALRIGIHVMLYPESGAVRHYFDVSSRDGKAVKITKFETIPLRFLCRQGGGYRMPHAYPPEFRSSRGFVRGRTVQAERDVSAICAGDGESRGLLVALDRTRGYGDLGRNVLVEQDGAFDFHTVFESAARLGSAPQRIGDVWVVSSAGTADDVLKRMPEWFLLTGMTLPDGRPDWIKDISLYMTHPGGRGDLCLRTDRGGFRRLEDYLPYLDALGVNCVWLRPVEYRHPYVPDDYYRLQDGIGSEGDFKSFVEAAHGLGIRVWRDAVMHGGRSDCKRAKDHPEWLCWNEQGQPQDSWWAFDMNWPGWIKYFADYIRDQTGKYGLDGWRLDVPSGSRFPNWNPNIPYGRASFSRVVGGNAQKMAIRKAMKEVNPDAADLAETMCPSEGMFADSIYDGNGPGELHFYRFVDTPPETVVQWLRRYYHDQKWCSIPGQVYMHHFENQDTLPAQKNHGRAAANAMLAVVAWSEGFPLLMDEEEDGAFENCRYILRTRSAAEELRRGDADYLGVQSFPGVFAVGRWTDDLASVALVSFLGTNVCGRVKWRDYAFDVSIPPFGAKVVRVKGPPLPQLENDEPWVPSTRAGNTAASVETCRIAPLRPGVESRAYKVPSVQRWIAHTAEAHFDNPFVVRHPTVDALDPNWDRRHLHHGAVRWDSRLHPFGFSREYASIVAVCGDEAVEFYDIPADADVCILDRIGQEQGFSVCLNRPKGSDEELKYRIVAAKDLVRSPIGTGDARLTVTASGWKFEDERWRVLIGINGTCRGIFRKTGSVWQPVTRGFGWQTTTGGGQKDHHGHESSLYRQHTAIDTFVRFRKDAQNRLVLAFEGELWGWGTWGRMRTDAAVLFRTEYTLGEDPIMVDTRFKTNRQLDAQQGYFLLRFSDKVRPRGLSVSPVGMPYVCAGPKDDIGYSLSWLEKDSLPLSAAEPWTGVRLEFSLEGSKERE